MVGPTGVTAMEERVAVMDMLRDFVTVCLRVPESVAWIVKLNVPVAVDVPNMTPVEVLRVSPVGSEPTVTAHV
jgi:hypothetical protein